MKKMLAWYLLERVVCFPARIFSRVHLKLIKKVHNGLIDADKWSGREVKLCIYYTDGEVVEKGFGKLKECLDYLTEEIAEKKEYADEIKIRIE